MTIIKDFPHILHGGDYNPDQWLNYPQVIDEDFKLMDEAWCNAFSIAIFAWGQLEPSEGVYEFGWLDDIMNRCAKSGKKVFLATPSAAMPAWLAHKYPETCRVYSDGQRTRWKARQIHCWSSPVLREKLAAINERLAERYTGHPALGGWHISNEYNGECFCESCLEKFYRFVEKRYGTLEKLNDAYWSGFWSHSITDWNQLNPLDDASDSVRLDWKRFTSWHIADFMKSEIDAVRKFSAAPATTNMMGVYPNLDYWRIAELCDFIADDCYPCWYNNVTENVAARFSMFHDMHYTMLNKPFLMMESCPGIPNYVAFPKMRRPNELEREMLLALGHGADGTMYFQWRKGRGGCEKIHGAVVGHDGTNQPRMFREVAAYGQKIAKLDEIVDSKIQPEAALIFDWESNWALEFSKGYGKEEIKKTTDTIMTHYRALWRQNIPLAVIESTCDFTPYKLLVVPMLFMLKPGVAERLRDFTADGGTVVMTYLSACVDDSNRFFFGKNPLSDVFGVNVEDIDCFEPSDSRSLKMADGSEFKVVEMSEYIHSEGAKVIASYTDEFFRGVPALTVNSFGQGQAWYLGARTGDDFLSLLYERILGELVIKPVLEDIPKSFHVAKRSTGNADYYFIYNLTAVEQEFKLPRPMADLWNGIESTTTVRIPANGATIAADYR